MSHLEKELAKIYTKYAIENEIPPEFMPSILHIVAEHLHMYTIALEKADINKIMEDL